MYASARAPASLADAHDIRQEREHAVVPSLLHVRASMENARARSEYISENTHVCRAVCVYTCGHTIHTQDAHKLWARTPTQMNGESAASGFG